MLCRSLLLLSLLVATAISYKLEYVSLVHRHGDRSPIFVYPTSPNPVYSWPQGLGQLSKRGMRQGYFLGRLLRARYVYHTRLLSRNYNRTETHLVSTETPRTMMTAETVLAALYRPGRRERFLRRLYWQPIPVFILHPEESILLPHSPAGPNCLAFQRLILAEANTLRQLQIRYQSFFDTLERHTGMSEVNINNVGFLADTIYVEYVSRRAPSWVTRAIVDKLVNITNQLVFLLSNTDEKRRLSGGVYAHHIMERMEMKANGTLPSSEASKLAIYSGHDITVATMLSVFGLYDGIKPSYTSAFIVELFSRNNQHFVQFLYRKGPWGRRFHRLRHPRCRDSQGRCTLTQLQQVMQQYRLTIPQWVQACR